MVEASKVRALDPALIDRLSGLSLVARTVVEGYMGGLPGHAPLLKKGSR